MRRFVNELMYGERDDHYIALAPRPPARLLGADAVLPTVVETIGQTLRLPYVAAHARRRDDVTAVYGDRHGPTPLSARASKAWASESSGSRRGRVSGA